jgi:hypothetical protein
MSDVLTPPLTLADETADQGIAGQIGPVEFNESRRFSGGNDGEILTRDSASATGALWTSTPTLTNLTLNTTDPMLFGPDDLQVMRVPDQAVFLRCLYLGEGGANSTRATGVGINPVDPLPFENDGSFNGLYNTFLGMGTGLANTGGNENTFVGSGAGERNVNGDQNAFVGFEAGTFNTSGYHNTFVGVWAGYQNTTGFFNTYVGTDIVIDTAGATGSNNTVIGASSASAFTTADSNAFVGVNAAVGMTSGASNAGVGRAVLQALTSGSFNTAIGRGAGSASNLGNGAPAGVGPTTGSSLTFLGSRTTVQPGAEAASNSTCIGNGSQINRTDQVVLGAFTVAQVKAHGDLSVIRQATLGTEVFNNGSLTGSTNWTAAGDFAIGASNATYTHATGTGTIAQTQANHATAVKTTRWYKLTYNVVSVSGSPTAAVTGFGSGAPQDNWQLDLTSTGTHVLFILTAGTTFTITGTSTTPGDTFTIDDLSLKEVQGGNIYVCGQMRLGSWATQTTIGAAGAASALPATPLGYIRAFVDNTEVAIPYYTRA